jgi:hypothetical protein
MKQKPLEILLDKLFLLYFLCIFGVAFLHSIPCLCIFKCSMPCTGVNINKTILTLVFSLKRSTQQLGLKRKRFFSKIFVIFVRKLFSRKAKINFHEIFAKIRKRKFSFQPNPRQHPESWKTYCFAKYCTVYCSDILWIT